jgi:HAD superfamily hydrolase (TIGR01549 family)
MATIDAVLFDLDDTLLGNNMERFLQRYFPLLAAYAQPIIAPDRFLQELLFATQAMIESDDPELTNCQVFWRVFCERNDLNRERVEPHFARFYRERFGELQPATQRRPEAAQVVKWCLAQGLKVVVATNPLFPLDAIEQRLAWAGLPVDDFDFALVTGCENMHSTKPNGAYYREILTAVGIEGDRALMVGDNWINDIAPAIQLGLYTFWIAAPDEPTPDGNMAPDGQGTLSDLFVSLKRDFPT